MRDHAVRMLMAMRRAGRYRRLMGMIVVSVAVGVLMRMGNVIVGSRVRMLRHEMPPGAVRVLREVADGRPRRTTQKAAAASGITDV